MGCGVYLSYVDDIALFSDDKSKLWAWKESIIARLARERLTIHDMQAQSSFNSAEEARNSLFLIIVLALCSIQLFFLFVPAQAESSEIHPNSHLLQCNVLFLYGFLSILIPFFLAVIPCQMASLASASSPRSWDCFRVGLLRCMRLIHIFIRLIHAI